jgi:signal transduction histidine kinase
MDASSTPIDTLRAIPLFAGLSDDGLRWVAAHATEESHGAHEVVFAEGAPADALWVIVEGEVRLTKRVGSDETLLTDRGAGGFVGEIPLLLGSPYLATMRTTAPSHLLRLDADTFREMLIRFPSALSIALQAMAERVGAMESIVQEREKLAALGTMAAGLAHEMNNPAAAARRAAERLRETSTGLREHSLALGKLLDAAQLDCLDGLAHEVVEKAGAAPALDTLAQSDREDELGTWLDDHSIEDGWDLASPFVVAGLDTAWLDGLADRFPTNTLDPIIRWLAAVLDESDLLATIDTGLTRVSGLVAAVKSYSYMDQAPSQEVDLHDGLDDTLTMLGYKLKKGITVDRDYDRSLPRICAFGSELNQVWTNVIDNAVDAMGGNGRLMLRTARDDDYALVEISDDGPGIPPDVLPRIFEPFFTTKGVGQGTGLGLDISYRIIVTRHHGDIAVHSMPGDTRVQVRIPLEVRC